MLDAKAGAFWCAPTTCAEQSSKALARALDRIGADYGKDANAWRWGPAHPALSGHRPFGNVPALARFFDVSVPVGGDPDRERRAVLGQPGSAALRHAPRRQPARGVRPGRPGKLQFIYQTGQSGLVFSSRYRDMAQEWTGVRYRPLQLHPTAWARQATLTP